MCAYVYVRACTIVEAVRSITDDGMWLASLWGCVEQVRCKGTKCCSLKRKVFFFVVIRGDLKKYSVTRCSGFCVNLYVGK